jgi:hypothetical protein
MDTLRADGRRAPAAEFCRDVEHLFDHMRAGPTRRHAADFLNNAEGLLRRLPEAERDRAYHAAERILDLLPDED